MTKFVGVGVYTRKASGEVTYSAYSYPWRNSLRLHRWINPPGWAGLAGVHNHVIDGDEIVFTEIDQSQVMDDDVYLGPYMFGP